MKKATILALFGIVLFMVLRDYYQQGNSGLPDPNVLTKPFYAYGVLALAADMIPGDTVLYIAAGVTLALYYQAQQKSALTQTATKPATKRTAQNG